MILEGGRSTARWDAAAVAPLHVAAGCERLAMDGVLRGVAMRSTVAGAVATAGLFFTIPACGGATCNSACQRVLTTCKAGCPTGVTAYGGYDQAQRYCEDHPGELGCPHIP